MEATQESSMQEFATGVEFDEDVRGFTINEQKEVEGRNIPDGWHTISIKTVTRVEKEDDVRLESLKPHYRSLYQVAFNVTVEGRKFPLTQTELVAGKAIQLTSARTGNQYYPTASRLGSNLARATKVDGGFQAVIDAAMTTPLWGQFKTTDDGFQHMERISAKMPTGNGAAGN